MDSKIPIVFVWVQTTAKAVRKFTSKFTIANAPNELQLLISIKKHFN